MKGRPVILSNAVLIDRVIPLKYSHLNHGLVGQVAVQERLRRKTEAETSGEMVEDRVRSVPRLLARHPQVFLEGTSDRGEDGGRGFSSF